MIKCEEHVASSVPPKQNKNRAKANTFENGKKIMTALKDAGYTKEQIIGICSCLFQESSWNPEAINANNGYIDRCRSGNRIGSGAGGICQWLPGCNGNMRQSDAVVYINEKTGSSYSINTWDAEKKVWSNNFAEVPIELQIKFMIHELNTTHKSADTCIRGCVDRMEACRCMVTKFEKPEKPANGKDYPHFRHLDLAAETYKRAFESGPEKT